MWSNIKQDLVRLNKDMGVNKIVESFLEGKPDNIENFKTQNQNKVTDEYSKELWREFIMNSGYSDYYKSELYREEKGASLLNKYK